MKRLLFLFVFALALPCLAMSKKPPGPKCDTVYDAGPWKDIITRMSIPKDTAETPADSQFCKHSWGEPHNYPTGIDCTVYQRCLKCGKLRCYLPPVNIEEIDSLISERMSKFPDSIFPQPGVVEPPVKADTGTYWVGAFRQIPSTDLVWRVEEQPIWIRVEAVKPQAPITKRECEPESIWVMYYTGSGYGGQLLSLYYDGSIYPNRACFPSVDLPDQFFKDREWYFSKLQPRAPKVDTTYLSLETMILPAYQTGYPCTLYYVEKNRHSYAESLWTAFIKGQIKTDTLSYLLIVKGVDSTLCAGWVAGTIVSQFRGRMKVLEPDTLNDWWYLLIIGVPAFLLGLLVRRNRDG